MDYKLRESVLYIIGKNFIQSREILDIPAIYAIHHIRP